MVMILLAGTLHAEKLPDGNEWEPLKVVESAFSRKAAIMDAEREQYATTLTGLAIKEIRDSNGSKKSLGKARKLMALALHLSPRNKPAVIANAQLSKGSIPKEIELEYPKAGFARVLLARSGLLEKQPGDENKLLARYMAGVAVDLDPENEDAIYLSEVHRLDHGELDWSKLTDPDVRQRP